MVVVIMMSEDIHKWTDGRYVLMFDEHTFFVFDNENDERMTALNVTKKLNEQQDLIEELYDFRLTYNALLFNEWVENQKYEVYKSRRHSDGELCFDGEYFIVVAQLPTGQVTNHYHIRHWDMFKINEYEKVKEDFDGHTSSDVIERLQQVIFNE